MPAIPFDIWIAALSTGYMSVEEAETILRMEWSRQSDFPSNHVPYFDTPIEIQLGFLYLLFTGGRLTMAEILQKAGSWTDNHGGPIACERFYYLLNEIDGGGPTRPSDKPLADRVQKLFAQFAATARESLSQLPIRK